MPLSFRRVTNRCLLAVGVLAIAGCATQSTRWVAEPSQKPCALKVTQSCLSEVISVLADKQPTDFWSDHGLVIASLVGAPLVTKESGISDPIAQADYGKIKTSLELVAGGNGSEAMKLAQQITNSDLQAFAYEAMAALCAHSIATASHCANRLLSTQQMMRVEQLPLYLLLFQDIIREGDLERAVELRNSLAQLTISANDQQAMTDLLASFVSSCPKSDIEGTVAWARQIGWKPSRDELEIVVALQAQRTMGQQPSAEFSSVRAGEYGLDIFKNEVRRARAEGQTALALEATRQAAIYGQLSGLALPKGISVERLALIYIENFGIPTKSVDKSVH